MKWHRSGGYRYEHILMCFKYDIAFHIRHFNCVNFRSLGSTTIINGLDLIIYCVRVTQSNLAYKKWYANQKMYDSIKDKSSPIAMTSLSLSFCSYLKWEAKIWSKLYSENCGFLWRCLLLYADINPNIIMC